MEKKNTHTHYQNTYWRKKKGTINLNWSYKEEQKSTKRKERERERERERENSHFCKCGKNMNWMGEMISNLYKIK